MWGSSQGRRGGCCGSVERPHALRDELSLYLAGKVGSGFQFAGFLLTPPPGAVLDL